MIVGVLGLAAGLGYYGAINQFSDNQKSIGEVWRSSMASKFQENIVNYNSAFDDESDTERDQSMVNTYYSLATDWYEFGWGRSFHFAHTYVDETFDDSIARHEHRIAEALNLKPGMHLLDIGSGVGGPAREIASKFPEVSITGITINDYQIERSTNLTRDAGLDDRLQFVQGDFTKMEKIADNTYDGAYAIEATCHSPELAAVYVQAYRVLKPGALFASYEWLTTDSYDPNNKEHKKAVDDIEYGNALPPLRTNQKVKDAATSVGFELVSDVDLVALDDGQVDWQYRLYPARQSAWGINLMCRLTEFLGMSPVGTADTHSMLVVALDGLIAGGELNVFTPMHLHVFRKPE